MRGLGVDKIGPQKIPAFKRDIYEIGRFNSLHALKMPLWSGPMNNKVSVGVVAIGNFDGVHKGHAALLADAKALSEVNDVRLAVLTFEPHPRQFFKPDTAPFRLTPAAAKERLLHEHGVERVEVIDFDAALAAMSAKDFIDKILVDTLKAKHVVVGADFHFGHDRAGNVATLQEDGRFLVHAVPLQQDGEEPVSSTRIRNLLTAGDINGANALLGWEWEIEGLVQHGDKRGRTLGYPTANIALNETLAPAHGIYAVEVKLEDDAEEEPWRFGVASLGMRPMFELKMPLLEVFLFKFEGDLYGMPVRVRLKKYIRPEQKFDSLEALKTQMDRDAQLARTALYPRK